MADPILCGFTVEQGRRICNQPAVGIYHGIGGDQPACADHAEMLRRGFGIRVAPVTNAVTTDDR